MIKRIAGMAVVSAVLCCVVAAQGPVPAAEGSGETAEQLTLRPDVETIAYEAPQESAAVSEETLAETLTPSDTYGKLLLFPAAVTGWRTDGTAVYRYAVADAQGEQLTKAVYTQAERALCGEQSVWLLTGSAGDGSTQITCAASDGKWVIGPITGSVTVMEGHLLVQSSGSAETSVYDEKGTLLGTVRGSVTSESDGVLVSCETTENGTIWHFYDASDLTALSEVPALQVGAFSGGSAMIQVSENQWGAVDEDGIVTLFNRVVWVDEMCNGYALAQDIDGKYGVVDASGKTAIEFLYIKGTRCSEEDALYQLWTSETECVVINTSWKNKKMALPDGVGGQELTTLPDDYFSYLNEDGCSVIFDDLQSIELEGEATFYRQGGMLLCVLENGYQIFNPDSENVSERYAYQYIAPSGEAAEEDSSFTVADLTTGQQGIADIKGKLVLEPVYDCIYSIGDDRYAAVQDGWSGVVDADGTWITRTRLSGAQ